MSKVTDVAILTPLPHSDQESPAIAVINAWLDEHHYGQLVEVSDHAGGKRAMQAQVYLGAFNYLDVPAFIATVKGAPWHRWDQGRVRLMVHEEEINDETGFTER